MSPAPNRRRVKVKESLVINPRQDVAALMKLHKFPRHANENKILSTKLSMRPRRREGGDQVPQPIRV